LRPPLRQSVAHYALSVAGVAFVTTVLAPFQASINSTTVALALLLAVLFAAALWGSRPALLASVVGVLCFNYFFLPPVHTFTIADPENWVALAAFLITAVTAGALSARARRRAEEAEAGRREIERLYKELQAAFERASHAEALRQSEKLKTALLDAVTHDLRTPLTSIKASITTLLDELDAGGNGNQAVALDDESRREMLVVINEESDRLNRFIGGLIELARIEAGEMRLRRNWGAAEEIIAAALTRAEPLTRGHVVKTEIEADLPVARVDARAVSEVIYTLVDNAAKYSPTGTTIRVEAARAGEDALQIAVEDEGRGIPLELRERVFDKFFRATRDGDVSTREPSGTGMGLAIAKGIVEAHGGRIRVEDGEAGKGTCVAFTLPIGDDEANGGESSAESSDVSDRIAAPSDDSTRADGDVEVSRSRVEAKP
jgi:two-component system sensor histidine kinase KdpD